MKPVLKYGYDRDQVNKIVVDDDVDIVGLLQYNLEKAGERGENRQGWQAI